MRKRRIAITAVLVGLFAFGAKADESPTEKYETALEALRGGTPDALKVLENAKPFKANDGFELQRIKCKPDAHSCIYYQARLITSVPFAYQGVVEAQRMVASCLRDGCDGAIVPDPVRGCAWRMVIAKVPSEEKDESDEWLLEGCTKRLLTGQSDKAREIALSILGAVNWK